MRLRVMNMMRGMSVCGADNNLIPFECLTMSRVFIKERHPRNFKAAVDIIGRFSKSSLHVTRISRRVTKYSNQSTNFSRHQRKLQFS